MKGMRLIVTRNCNITCSHCEYECGPHRKGIMSVKNFKNNFLEGYREGFNEYIIIEGGEIMNHSGIVFKYLKGISSYDIKKILVTNGFWGNLEIYRDILKELRNIGASTMLFEYDYFHSLYIELDTIRKAIMKATECGFDIEIKCSFITNNIGVEIDEITFNYIKYFKEHFNNIRFNMVYIDNETNLNKERVFLYK